MCQSFLLPIGLLTEQQSTRSTGRRVKPLAIVTHRYLTGDTKHWYVDVSLLSGDTRLNQNNVLEYELLTVEEVAEILRVTPATVKRYLRAGRFEGAIKLQRRWLVPSNKVLTAAVEVAS